MSVASASPSDPNANPTSSAAGRATAASSGVVRPSTAMRARNATLYSEPRIMAQPSSPNATSTGVTGVLSTPSYSLANFIFAKKFMAASATAPFMAEAASSAGARKVRYGTVRPSDRGMSPTSAPTPHPMATRYSSGSTNPENTSHHYEPLERSATTTRAVTPAARRRPRAPP